MNLGNLSMALNRLYIGFKTKKNDTTSSSLQIYFQKKQGFRLKCGIETDNVYEYMMTLPIKVRNRIHWLGSGKGKERSKFYEGIAEAMAEQWGNLE